MSRSWTIGSAPESDLVVSLPTVSGRHCRLTLEPDGTYRLEDLESTNGTHVNGNRVTHSIRVSRGDTITLGHGTPMPWPAVHDRKPFLSLTLGREPDNDIVIASPVVSGHHARIRWEGNPSEAFIEDLGSSNGTAIQTPDRKVTHAAFQDRDVIYLGSVPLLGSHLLACLNPGPLPQVDISAASLLIGRDPLCDYVIDLPMVSSRHAELSLRGDEIWIDDRQSSNGTFVNAVQVDGKTAVRPGDVISLGSYSLRVGSIVKGGAGARITPVVSRPADFAASGSSDWQNPIIQAGPLPSMAQASPAWAAPPHGSRIEGGLPSAAAVSSALAPARFGSTFAQFWRESAQWLTLLLLGPIAALTIAVVSRMDSASLSTVLHRTSVAAVIVGFLNPILSECLISKRRVRNLQSGLPPFLATCCALALIVLGQCVALWGLVSILSVSGPSGGGSLNLHWPISLGLLVLGSTTALAISVLVATTILAREELVVGIALIVLVGLIAVGGGGGPSVSRGIRLVANGSPTRWVYEGLLLVNGDEAAAETAFPASEEQMGLAADVLALAFMLVGLTASAGFISQELGPKPALSRARPSP